MAIVNMLYNEKGMPTSWHQPISASTDFNGAVTVLVKSYSGSPAYLKEQEYAKANNLKDLSIETKSYLLKDIDLTLENVENELLKHEDFKGGKRYRINSEGKAEEIK